MELCSMSSLPLEPQPEGFLALGILPKHCCALGAAGTDPAPLSLRGEGAHQRGRSTQGRPLHTPCACYCYNKSQSCVWKG